MQFRIVVKNHLTETLRNAAIGGYLPWDVAGGVQPDNEFPAVSVCLLLFGVNLTEKVANESFSVLLQESRFRCSCGHNGLEDCRNASPWRANTTRDAPRRGAGAIALSRPCFIRWAERQRHDSVVLRLALAQFRVSGCVGE